LEIDFTGVGDDVDLFRRIAARETEIITSSKEKLLVLKDATNVHIILAFVHLEKEATMLQKKFILKNALVGISAPFRSLLNSFNVLMGVENRLFETREEAREWLVKD
jgi:hypothetical protein